MTHIREQYPRVSSRTLEGLGEGRALEILWIRDPELLINIKKPCFSTGFLDFVIREDL